MKKSRNLDACSSEINFDWFSKSFKKLLVLPKKKPKKPIILAPAGPSRVGKTTVMRFIEKRLPYFVHVAHDEMRLFFYRRGWPDSRKVENFIY